MPRDLNLRPLLLLLLCMCLPPPAQAQEAPPLEALPASDVERMELNPGRGSLLVGGGELLLEHEFRVAVGTHYQRTPLRMNLGGQRLELIGHRVMALVTGAFGVLPWLEVDLQIPLVLMQTGDDTAAQGFRSPTSRGLGTPTAYARMGFLSRRDGKPLDLAVNLGLGLPVGSAEVLAREPWPRLHSQVQLGSRLGPLRVAFDGGLLLRVPGRLGPEALTRSSQGQELRLGGALATTGEELKVEGAIRAALAMETGRGSTEFLGGLRYTLFSWRKVIDMEVFGVGGVGLGSLPGTPGFRMLVGVAAGSPPPPEKPDIVIGDDDIIPMTDASEKAQPSRALVPTTEPNDSF